MNRLLSTCFSLLLSVSVFAQAQMETSLIKFGLDEDALSAFAKTQLAEIAEEASSSDIYKIELFGHTDQQGEDSYNLALASRRAENVAQALVELGLNEKQVLVRSFGESRLLENANSEEAFAKNRRVELTLHTEKIRSEDRLFEILSAARTYRDVINHDQENQLTGNEGVKLSIPANAFVYANGSALPSGAQVEVILEEATRPSSMMAHRLSTNGKSGRLSTGGMVRVTGMYQGETLHLAPGRAIDVVLPTQEFDAEMRLYVGEKLADTGMDWKLDTGESVKESTRISEGKKKRKLSEDEIELVEEIKGLLSKRDRYLMALETARLESYRAPSFPTFKALPKEFDPNARIPKRPFIPAAPTRKVAEKSGLFSLKGVAQRKLDAAFIADSLAYAQELPGYEEKIAAFADLLAKFKATTPDRAKAHQASVDETVEFRVTQAQEYLQEQFSYSAARNVLLWKEKVETTGPYAKKSLKKLLMANLVATRGHADPEVVIDKALGPQRLTERFTRDTAGFSFEKFERNFQIEKELVVPMDSVKMIQKRVEGLFSALQSLRNYESNRKASKLNKMLTSSYAFQIRTPAPVWHNCDHPLPEGLFQLMVSKPSTAPTYFYSQQEKTLDYFPAGKKAAVAFNSPVSLNILSFGVLEDSLKLATKSSKASKSQQGIPLEYRDATLEEIEQALIALDTNTPG